VHGVGFYLVGIYGWLAGHGSMRVYSDMES